LRQFYAGNLPVLGYSADFVTCLWLGYRQLFVTCVVEVSSGTMYLLQDLESWWYVPPEKGQNLRGP